MELVTLGAWQTERFRRAKRLPTLKKALKEFARRPETGPQTQAQMKAALQIMSEQYGIPLGKPTRE